MLGSYSRSRPGFIGSALRIAGRRRARARDSRGGGARAPRASATSRSIQPPGLPYGTLKRIELARAVFQRPAPADAGRAGERAQPLARSSELAELIRGLRSDLDLTILLVEHNMGMVMGHLRPGRGPRPRPQDRRGRAARGAGGPAGDRGLPGGARMSLRRGRGPAAPATGRCTCSRASTSRSRRASRMALLGPNGAGKTTVLRALSGMVKTVAAGCSSTGRAWRAWRRPTIARRGVAHVPEGRGTLAAADGGGEPPAGRLRAPRRRRASSEDLGRCYGWFPRLEERRRQPAGSLSGGEQQMLAVARALMLRPRLLMLDEPSLGLAPIVTRELFKVLGEICDEQGMTVLLVEQNANLALDFADHAYVLESGRIALSGRGRRDQGRRRGASLLPGVLMERFIQVVVDGIATGSIYAAVALALVLIFRSTGIVNFAQGEMAMFSTFVAWGLYEAGVPLGLAVLTTLGALVRRRHGHRARADPPLRGRRRAHARDRHARPLHPAEQPRRLDLGLWQPRLPEPVPGRLRRPRRRPAERRVARHRGAPARRRRAALSALPADQDRARHARRRPEPRGERARRACASATC